MKFLAILLCISIVAVVTAIQDPLQHVLQKVEQLERSNEAIKKRYDEKIANLEQQLKWQRNLSLQSGELFHEILSKYLSISNTKTH